MLDEPTTVPHLAGAGTTVITVEDHFTVVAHGDHLISMGLCTGSRGGTVTGTYLKEATSAAT